MRQVGATGTKIEEDRLEDICCRLGEICYLRELCMPTIFVCYSVQKDPFGLPVPSPVSYVESVTDKLKQISESLIKIFTYYIKKVNNLIRH
jgi:hypothetical protein